MIQKKEILGAYRGFVITKITKVLDSSDYESELQRSGAIGMPWVAELIKQEIGVPKEYYNVQGVNIIFDGFAKLEYAKSYIDRIMAGELEIYDDGLDYVDDSPAKYKGLSYCVNENVTCNNCYLKNYNYDCKNNRII